MTSCRTGIILAATLAPLLWPFSARADWAQSSDPLVVRANPSGGDVQLQNPPTFTWARSPGAARYEIEISEGRFAAGATVDRTWYLPARSLARAITPGACVRRFERLVDAARILHHRQVDHLRGAGQCRAACAHPGQSPAAFAAGVVTRLRHLERAEEEGPRPLR
jgi:hypothetical protein